MRISLASAYFGPAVADDVVAHDQETILVEREGDGTQCVDLGRAACQVCPRSARPPRVARDAVPMA